MKISKSTAMRIVTELKNIIQQDITLMDRSAHIIACTERERIGDFHGATQRMLAEDLSILIAHTDDEYAGTHAGVNLLIEVEGEAIGVVGVTGEYHKVEKYGRIIKKMTEILLLDEYLKEQKRSDERLLALARRVREQMELSCGVRLRIGIDSAPVSGGQAHAGYLRAEKALRGACGAGRGGVAFYDDINVEIFIRDIPEASKKEFIARVFRGVPQEEIGQWLRILDVLYQCNGSIQQAAERLYLHKNTLQYKLNKLYRLTGYDPRSLADSSLYYIAMAFYEGRP